MNNPATQAYLRTKVLTANPEELRLMLFDGALKFCRAGRAEIGRDRPDFEALFVAFSRAKNVVMELANGLDRTQDAELCDRMSAVFHFIYKLLVEANMERDAAKADEAIALLTYERETWTLAVEKGRTEIVPGSGPPQTLSRSA